MTIKELITKLKKFPSGARVFVSGYEGGLDDPVIAEELSEIAVDVVDSDFGYGKHRFLDDCDNFDGIREIGIVIAPGR